MRPAPDYRTEKSVVAIQGSFPLSGLAGDHPHLQPLEDLDHTLHGGTGAEFLRFYVFFQKFPPF